MTENLGWIKLHRSIIDWEWFDDANTLCLWIHLLLKANYKDSTWHGTKVKRGSLIAGRIELSKMTGISEQSIRTSLTRLKSTNNITIKSTNKYSVISIINYDLYQDTNQQANQQLTSNQPATNHVLRNKEIKKNHNKGGNMKFGVEGLLEREKEKEARRARKGKSLHKTFEEVYPKKIVQTLPPSPYPSIESIGEKELLQVCEEMKIYPADARKKLKDLKTYCESTGATYRDYLSTLKTFIQRDLDKGNIVPTMSAQIEEMFGKSDDEPDESEFQGGK